MADRSTNSLGYIEKYAGRLWRVTQLHARIWKAIERRASGEGFTFPQVRIMLAIADACAVTNGELARQLQMVASQVSVQIARLSAKGLISEERSTANRRQILRSLTPAGQAAVARIREKVAKAYRLEFDRLSGEEQAVLAASLQSPISRSDAQNDGLSAIVRLRPIQAAEYGWLLSQLTTLGRELFGWGEPYLIANATMIATHLRQAPSDFESAWGATVNDRLAGGCVMTYGADPVRRDLENHGAQAWVSALFVISKFQGKGIGARLLDRCIAEAAAIDVRTLHIRLSERQKHLIKLVKRAGFRQREITTTDGRYGPTEVWREFVYAVKRPKSVNRQTRTH